MIAGTFLCFEIGFSIIINCDERPIEVYQKKKLHFNLVVPDKNVAFNLSGDYQKIYSATFDAVL